MTAEQDKAYIAELEVFAANAMALLREAEALARGLGIGAGNPLVSLIQTHRALSLTREAWARFDPVLDKALRQPTFNPKCRPGEPSADAAQTAVPGALSDEDFVKLVKACPLSDEHLAQRLCITVSTARRWRTGESVPHPRVRDSVRKALEPFAGWVPCPACNGIGAVSGHTCDLCNGTSEVSSTTAARYAPPAKPSPVLANFRAGDGFEDWWTLFGSKVPGGSELATKNVAEVAWREGRCTLVRQQSSKT